MNADQNEHIEVHEIRGLASSNLHTAFQEIDAASMGTKCKKPFFHVQLSPPANADISIQQFERAVEAVEKKVGLVGHPRAIVFHEKEGRRHAHAVWSRLHVKEVSRKNRQTGESEKRQKLVARQMPHFKIKLNELSLALYYENGLEPPRGFLDKKHRDPDNYDRKIWMQSKRLDADPRNLKAIIRTSLLHSDTRKDFEARLKDHGMYLAQGERVRKGKSSPTYLVVHHSGEPMSMTRYSEMTGKEIAPRIGEAKDLPTLAQVQGQIREQQSKAIKQRLEDLKLRQEKDLTPLMTEKKAVVHNQRDERTACRNHQKERWKQEALGRANRLRKGIMGMWDRVSGRHGKVAQRNKEEITENRRRDYAERQSIYRRHLAERQELQKRIMKIKAAHEKEKQKLVRELGHSVQVVDKHLTNEFNRQNQEAAQTHDRSHIRDEFGDAARQGETERLKDTFNRETKDKKEEKKKDDRTQGRGRTRKRDPH
ncbi:MAG: hypothetical protein R3E57_07355 [Porticoccaceae bacterium]